MFRKLKIGITLNGIFGCQHETSVEGREQFSVSARSARDSMA